MIIKTTENRTKRSVTRCVWSLGMNSQESKEIFIWKWCIPQCSGFFLYRYQLIGKNGKNTSFDSRALQIRSYLKSIDEKVLNFIKQCKVFYKNAFLIRNCIRVGFKLHHGTLTLIDLWLYGVCFITNVDYSLFNYWLH